VIKTQGRETGIPYSEETIREAVSLLREEASIEGSGNRGAIRVSTGITGCVVTPLTIGTAPLLFGLCLGQIAQPVFVSETRNLYRQSLSLLPMEDGPCFDLIQERGTVRTLYEGCRVTGFELRIHRGEAIKLKLDIAGDMPPGSYPYEEIAPTEGAERFSGDTVSCKINHTEHTNIYGMTITARKEGAARTEVRIHRILDTDTDLPSSIEDLTISAHLYRERYERRAYGLFRLALSRLVLMADETTINSADTVIGPLRYYCGGLSAEVFTNTGEAL
jgi:hypothetical protein